MKLRQINIGKKLSEETKQKIGKSSRNQRHTEETKLKISIWNKSKIVSEETRKKQRKANTGENNPNYGKKCSEETKEKLRQANSGEKHYFFGKKRTEEEKKKFGLLGELNPNWRGGLKGLYCVNWCDDLKIFIKERDEYKCQNPYCKHTNNNLVVHHINYLKKDCSPSNLVTLCNSCHSRTNYNRNFWEKVFLRRKLLL